MRTSARAQAVDEDRRQLSPQLEHPRKGANLNIPRPRSLAGVTILQLVPALTNDPVSQAAVDLALTLLQSGARAIVAGENGSLVHELSALGDKWLPMTIDTVNPLRIRANARNLS
jgi:hypothetical protein